jgi:hypothetical protein
MMATKLAIWHGTDRQLKDLMRAVSNHCTCETPTIVNANPPKCPAHQMLLDQDALNHFAFVGTRRQRYWFNEFLT